VPPARHPKSLAAKLFASIGVLGAAASCSGRATFTDAVAAPTALRIDASARPRLIVLAPVLQPATAVAPGDRISRALVLTARRRGFKRLSLTVEAKKASLLTDRAQGFRLAIARCAKQWRRTGTRYTCRGETKVVLTPSPALGRRRLVRVSLRRGKRLYLLLTLTLPGGAGNSLQGLKTTLVYRFTGR